MLGIYGLYYSFKNRYPAGWTPEARGELDDRGDDDEIDEAPRKKKKKKKKRAAEKSKLYDADVDEEFETGVMARRRARSDDPGESKQEDDDEAERESESDAKEPSSKDAKAETESEPKRTDEGRSEVGLSLAPRVKWLALAVAVLALVGLSGVGYLLVAFPKAGAPPTWRFRAPRSCSSAGAIWRST
jgi:cobalamin biosynthesis Mg chelatase CobN